MKRKRNANVRSEVIKSLLKLRDTGFFSKKKTMSEIRDALHARGLIVPLTALSPYLLKLIRNDELKRERGAAGKKRVWIYYFEKEIHPLPKLLPTELVKNKEFKTEVKDFNLVYGKSGTCTAFLLRKMLEKAIFLAFARHGLSEKLCDAQGNFRGLGDMIEIASREKLKGTPFLLPKTAKQIKGIKFLGDVAAHNFLVNVKMEEITPQMPFIITALKELSRKF